MVQAGLTYVLADRQGSLIQYGLMAAQVLALWVAQFCCNIRDGIAGIAPFPALPLSLIHI